MIQIYWQRILSGAAQGVIPSPVPAVFWNTYKDQKLRFTFPTFFSMRRRLQGEDRASCKAALATREKRRVQCFTHPCYPQEPTHYRRAGAESVPVDCFSPHARELLYENPSHGHPLSVWCTCEYPHILKRMCFSSCSFIQMYDRIKSSSVPMWDKQRACKAVFG